MQSVLVIRMRLTKTFATDEAIMVDSKIGQR